MKNFTSCKGLLKSIIIRFILSFSGLSAQTPGLICEPATGSFKAGIDPNGDGYVSLNTNGFTTDDQLQNEIDFITNKKTISDFFKYFINDIEEMALLYRQKVLLLEYTAHYNHKYN